MVGVTSLISEFCKPFDRQLVANKMAKSVLRDLGEKATKENVAREAGIIIEDWEAKRKRGIDYHTKLNNKDLSTLSNCIMEGRSENTPFEDIKYSPKVKNNTVYLEKFVYSDKYSIIGYADKVVVERNKINIIDNKIVDNIPRTSTYKSNTGYSIKGDNMTFPLEHLEDCKYNRYTLQLSLYMYMLWEANKDFKPGTLHIRHVKLNDNNKVLSDEMIEVPYMRTEVKNILKYLKLNES